MNNKLCPICDEEASGKPVRGVNFCKNHKDLVIMIRDAGYLDGSLDKYGRCEGEPFIKYVKRALRILNADLVRVGEMIAKTS